MNLPKSPQISLYLPISPYISLDLPISPYVQVVAPLLAALAVMVTPRLTSVLISASVRHSP